MVGQAPKHFLFEPALAASLLGLSKQALMSGEAGLATSSSAAPIFGRLFENLVALHLQTFAIGDGLAVRHYRASNGSHEVDFILEQRDGRFLAIESKLAGAPNESDFKHLHWLKEKMGDQMIDAIVITAGQYAYRTKSGIAVIPLAMMKP